MFVIVAAAIGRDIVVDVELLTDAPDCVTEIVHLLPFTEYLYAAVGGTVDHPTRVGVQFRGTSPTKVIGY